MFRDLKKVEKHCIFEKQAKRSEISIFDEKHLGVIKIDTNVVSGKRR
jgi:hypothetical protein